MAAPKKLYYAAPIFSGVNGKVRTRLPDAAKIAFAIAGWTTAVLSNRK
jgi:hypothetical protein